jgi:hypothetical protein
MPAGWPWSSSVLEPGLICKQCRAQLRQCGLCVCPLPVFSFNDGISKPAANCKSCASINAVLHQQRRCSTADVRKHIFHYGGPNALASAYLRLGLAALSRTAQPSRSQGRKSYKQASMHVHHEPDGRQPHGNSTKALGQLPAAPKKKRGRPPKARSMGTTPCADLGARTAVGTHILAVGTAVTAMACVCQVGG